MCGGGGSSGPSQAQVDTQNAQLVQQAQISAAQLAEQQRQFDAQQAQSAQTLANTKALQDKAQTEADTAAQNANWWQTGRAHSIDYGTKQVNDAFASFTPGYYQGFTKAYTDHYTPEVERQFADASNRTTFGLARSGNLNSQTAANQIGELAIEHGKAIDDVNNQAVAATTQIQGQVTNAKAGLLGQVSSDATVGSPVTPSSADAITANFNNINSNLSRLGTQAGDVVTTMQATPSYSSLGTLFGSAAQSGASALTGINQANYSAAYNAGLGGVGAANPNSAGSGTVRK